jgi:type II secretory pathway pseudopilin PulG
MVELVAVLLLAGVLAAVALPKLDGAFAMRSDTARDEALAALRYAAQSAHSHRRLVCVTVGSSAIALAIATSRGAGSCDAALAGPDGSTPYTANPGGAAFTLTPAGTLYFQPDGRATSDAAGANASTRTLGIAGATSSITILGESGLVQ